MSLSQSEIKKLISLLQKIRHPSKELSAEVFDELMHVVPFCACELIVAGKKGQLLLTYRDDDFWQGWHFPGGLLRYGDSFEKRLRYVAKHELGVGLKSYEFLFPTNYLESPRAHNVSLAFLCEIEGEPTDGKFFSEMPKDIIKEHKQVWKLVKKSI